MTAILFGIQDGELPKSKIVYNGQTSEQFAKRVEAKILTRNGEGGSKPRETNKFYKILFKRKKGNGVYYVRGHMLNDNVHGPGDLKNLTPLSVKGNKNHLLEAEKFVKTAVNAGAVVRYTVSAKYDRPAIKYKTSDQEFDNVNIPEDERENIKKIREVENKVPSSLMLGAFTLKKTKNGKWINDKVLVNGKKILNPVETDLNTYSAKKEVISGGVVSLKTSSVDELVKVTLIEREFIEIIHNAAKLISEPIDSIETIKEKLVDVKGYDESFKPFYDEALTIINKIDRKKLN